MTVAEAMQRYIEGHQSMVEIARQTGVEVDDLHSEVDRHSSRVLGRTVRAVKKNIGERPISCEILSHIAPVPRIVTMLIRPTSEWLRDEVGHTETVEIRTNEPIGPQVAAAIDTVAEAIASDHTVVHDDDNGMPCGVYDVQYYHYRDGDFALSSSCDSNVGAGYVQRLHGRLKLGEVAVSTCQSQPGGAIIAGSAEAMRRWMS